MLGGWRDTIIVDEKCWANLERMCLIDGWEFDGDCDLSNECKREIDILSDQCDLNGQFDGLPYKWGE